MTLAQWKKAFKKANQRVDKAFVNYTAYLDTHYYFNEYDNNYCTLGNGACLQKIWFEGRKSGWRVMCYATEFGINYRKTSTGKFMPVSFNTVKRLEVAIENATDTREELLEILDRAQKSGLDYDAYDDDSVWTTDKQQNIL